MIVNAVSVAVASGRQSAKVLAGAIVPKKCQMGSGGSCGFSNDLAEIVDTSGFTLRAAGNIVDRIVRPDYGTSEAVHCVRGKTNGDSRIVDGEGTAVTAERAQVGHRTVAIGKCVTG